MGITREKILAELIIKIRFGTASKEEIAEVESWLKERKENQQVYERIISGKSITDYLEREVKVEAGTDFDVVSRQMQMKLNKRRTKRHLRVIGWLSGAAACCVGIMLVSIFWNMPDKSQHMFEDNKKLSVDEKVCLVLSSGETIGLTGKAVDSIRLEQSVIVRQDNQLLYKGDENFKDGVVEECNKIVTMAGGEYSFILSDGTRVWLNAESELDFPVNFVSQERVVKLKGEAFFEVHPDAEHPFIVETKNVKMRVLGTSFNVKAYDNEEAVWTTLLTGKVKVSSVEEESESVILTPGMQALWQEEDMKMTVKEKVNTEHFIAWKNGLFMFDNEDISAVVRVLERWYDVKFVYQQNGTRHHTFSGCLSKDDSLQSTLETLTFTGGPLFKIENNVVYIIDK